MENPPKKQRTSSVHARTQNASATQKTKKIPIGKKLMEKLPTTEIEIAFTVKGNAMNNYGNPISKLKMTGRQFWLPKARRYVEWKQKVMASLLDQTRDHPARYWITRNIALLGKPLGTAKDLRGHMSINIFWADNTHGDPENVFGSIADSVFFQDKYLDGSFISQMSATKEGRVDIIINLKEIQQSNIIK